MRADDCAALIEDLHERIAQEMRDSENLAMLVDRKDFDLTFDYVNAVHDPDDPEAKKAREERKQQGIKPPPMPIIRPVAHRRPEITAALVEACVEREREANEPVPPKGADGKPLSKMSQIRMGWG
jgi:hypothetical protein